jgi:hypothetical protein
MHVNAIIVFCPAYDLRNVPIQTSARIQTFHTYVCPFRVEWHCPVEASQILTLSSFLALATPPPSLYGLVKRLPSQAAPTVQNMRVPSNAPRFFWQKEPSSRTCAHILSLSISLVSHHTHAHAHAHAHTHLQSQGTGGCGKLAASNT